MELPEKAQILRVFVGESDRHGARPVYQAIVEAARAKAMAGATVIRGTLGFGVHSRLHTAKVLRLSEDLPMVVEIVDTPERIEDFLKDIAEMGVEGLITVEDVRVVRYGGRQG